jgi:Di-haem oxidoreductase, putative peroxidase
MRPSRAFSIGAIVAAGILVAGAGPAAATSNTRVTNLSGFGDPLQAIQNEVAFGITQRFQQFAEGQLEFVDVEELPRGGPIFNSRSCGACHFQPAVGGSGEFINEVRIRNNTAGGPLHIFGSDNILRLGPQTQGSLTIFPTGVHSTPIGCQITSPNCIKSVCQQEEATRTTFATTLRICDPTSASFTGGQNCTAERQSTPLFGFGFIEAVADATFDAIAAAQPAAIRGVVKRVTEFGRTRVARFGWKDDVATLRNFSSDAYLNEMGITNPDRPNELTNCALNVTQFGVLLDAADDPEDETEDDGRADTDRFADFMRALDVPPTLQLSNDASQGQALFHVICSGCHVETIRTAADPSQFIPPTTGGVPIDNVLLEVFLDNEDFHPFSDFLLHDMGSLGDGITSGAAGPRMMRTAPLWGIRAKSKLLHDGRATTIEEAVAFHDGQGATARNVFASLTAQQKAQIVAFLMTR